MQVKGLIVNKVATCKSILLCILIYNHAEIIIKLLLLNYFTLYIILVYTNKITSIL